MAMRWFLCLLCLPFCIAAQTPQAKSNGNGGLNKDYLTGRFDPSTDSRFVRISDQHSTATRYMRKEAYTAFVLMYDAAKKEGIILTIISATRTFEQQRAVWDAKWLGKRQVDGIMLSQTMPAKQRAEKILRWSAMPGTSRHHWGTDIDINSVSPAYWNSSKGKKEYAWLQKNAFRYGFCQTYSALGLPNGRKSGYQEEKWHWSYMPVSEKLLTWYVKMITDKDLYGFLGASTAVELQIIKKYVIAINPSCR
jgi:D-alanyl-D-alanine carboxypeptidase